MGIAAVLFREFTAQHSPNELDRLLAKAATQGDETTVVRILDLEGYKPYNSMVMTHVLQELMQRSASRSWESDSPTVSLDTVKKLVDAGAKIDTEWVNQANATPLESAITIAEQRGDQTIFEYFLNSGKVSNITLSLLGRTTKTPALRTLLTQRLDAQGGIGKIRSFTPMGGGGE